MYISASTSTSTGTMYLNGYFKMTGNHTTEQNRI